MEDGSAITLMELRVDGNDLHNELGIPRGPIIGDILNRLLHECHGCPKLNNREWLLLEANRRYKKLRGKGIYNVRQ